VGVVCIPSSRLILGEEVVADSLIRGAACVVLARPWYSVIRIFLPALEGNLFSDTTALVRLLESA